MTPLENLLQAAKDAVDHIECNGDHAENACQGCAVWSTLRDAITACEAPAALGQMHCSKCGAPVTTDPMGAVLIEHGAKVFCKPCSLLEFEKPSAPSIRNVEVWITEGDAPVIRIGQNRYSRSLAQTWVTVDYGCSDNYRLATPAEFAVILTAAGFPSEVRADEVVTVNGDIFESVNDGTFATASQILELLKA